MKNCIGIINLDENEDRMGELVRNRPLASVPIAGRYRVVDFILSNMTNSGIESIGIFTKNKSRSLMDHLTNGRPWDLHRKKDGLRVFNFGYVDPAYDDVHNFIENIEFLKHSRKEFVLVSSSYMICNIDYEKVLDFHEKNQNDVTIVYKKVNNANKAFLDCNTLNIDDNGFILSIGENIGREEHANISMEMFMMRADLFIEIVYESVKKGMYRKLKQFIRENLSSLKVKAYEYDGYLTCINSLSAYYNANMDLLKPKINNELFFENGPIYTKAKDECPTHYTESSNVTNSIIANGSYIEGNIENCIISRRVYVGAGTTLKNCIILQNTNIGDNVTLDRVITDKGVTIKDGENLIGYKDAPLVMKKPTIL